MYKLLAHANIGHNIDKALLNLNGTYYIKTYATDGSGWKNMSKPYANYWTAKSQFDTEVEKILASFDQLG